jgi:hypothetical protein
MVDVTQETEVTYEDLVKLVKMQSQLAKLKGAEAMLRKRVFKHYFPAPTEGSKDNKVPLNDGTGAIVQGEHTVNRKVDEGELEQLKEAIFAEGSNLPQLDFPNLIKWKPEVAIPEYRKLSVSDRYVFDRCLVVTDGMPGLKVVIPKR